MKKNDYYLVLRLIIALTVWFFSYKAYAKWINPILMNTLPQTLCLILKSMVVPYTLSLGGYYAIVKNMRIREKTSPAIVPGFGRICRLFVIQSGLSFPVTVLSNLVCMLIGISPKGMTADELFGEQAWFFFVLLLIFNPIFEELLFRKLTLDRLLVLGEKPAILISAILFALPHVISVGVPQMFYAFVLGIVWGYIKVKTGKLWPAMVLHSLSNIYGSYIPLLAKTTVPTTVLFMLVYLIVMPLLAILLLVRWKRRLAPHTA